MSDAKTSWDSELDQRATAAPLLQTWGWGEVQSRAGWSVERVRLAGGAMASVQLRGFGGVREAYVPRGPVPASAESVAALVEWARNACRPQRVRRPVPVWTDRPPWHRSPGLRSPAAFVGYRARGPVH